MKRSERHIEQFHDSVKTGTIKPEYEVACQDKEHPAGVPIFYRIRLHPDAMIARGYAFRCPVCRVAYQRNRHKTRMGYAADCQHPDHPADVPRRFYHKSSPALQKKRGCKMNCPLCRRPDRNEKPKVVLVKPYVADWTRYTVQPWHPPEELLREPKTSKDPKPEKPKSGFHHLSCRDPLHNSALHSVRFKTKLSVRMYRERGYAIRCPGCRKRRERQRWKRITPAVQMVIDPPMLKKTRGGEAEAEVAAVYPSAGAKQKSAGGLADA